MEEKEINSIEKDLIAFNRYGGFTKEGKEYLVLNPNTPAPWCNILANENFGTIVSTKGNVYTYFKNSREFKITNWSNDWTKEELGENISGIFSGNHNLTYGFGYVKVREEDKYFKKKCKIFVSMNEDVKVETFKIENTSDTYDKFVLEYSLVPCLGVSSDVDGENIISRLENDDTIVFKNPYNKYFGNVVSYFSALKNDNTDVTIIVNKEKFSIKVICALNPGEISKFTILLGAIEEENYDIALLKITGIKRKYQDLDNIYHELKNVKNYWEKKVVKKFNTGDKYIDIMANGWLLYQTICCRLFAKTSFYQSGGAIGYRDQLQDTMAIISVWPEKTRAQIIMNAGKQFEKGDVLHWWHTHTGAGIRTYFSDDYLWLPYVLCEYLIKTKDMSILEIEAPYLENKEMGDRRELYEVFNEINVTDNIYNHAKKAIMYGLSRINEKNGLLDIGDGDWNDGFSSIRGQSVWLTFFMMDILKKFKDVAKYMKDDEMAKRCDKYRNAFKHSIIDNAWDGNHFVRAYFANGEVLGSNKNEECKIDLISQAWAAIALKDYKDMQDEINKSLESAEKYLVDNEHQIVKLLYPPFDKPKNNPGYIKAYVPGTRENGGQYTHAATWLAKAYFELGRDEDAMRILRYINPIYHSDLQVKANVYMVEPYVVAADVYSNPEHLGRGGWTWYTGSSGWTYKVIEDHFGEKKK